jgi:hypothetical protein
VDVDGGSVLMGDWSVAAAGMLRRASVKMAPGEKMFWTKEKSGNPKRENLEEPKENTKMLEKRRRNDTGTWRTWGAGEVVARHW